MFLHYKWFTFILIGCSQTIKCLLIVPNPESALNEEAGKMLLEHYDDYCTRARMFTEIHARPSTKYVNVLLNVCVGCQLLSCSCLHILLSKSVVRIELSKLIKTIA